MELVCNLKGQPGIADRTVVLMVMLLQDVSITSSTHRGFAVRWRTPDLLPDPYLGTGARPRSSFVVVRAIRGFWLRVILSRFRVFWLHFEKPNLVRNRHSPSGRALRCVWRQFYTDISPPVFGVSSAQDLRTVLGTMMTPPHMVGFAPKTGSGCH